jgi:hypothetical protein
MGFFDKKRRPEDEEEGVVTGEILPPIARTTPPPPPPAELQEMVSQEPTAPPAIVMGAKMTPPPAPVELEFGIDDAVLLVRQLPTRNTDLVMQVVKKTLESVHVDVSRIIDGATKKEQVIEDRIGTLRKNIETLESQITAAKKEIGTLETEQKEISSVKERLLLAQKIESEVISDRPAPAPISKPAALVAPPSPPSLPPPPPKS